MVTTNCRELTGQGTCTVPLTGNSLPELQKNVFQHGEQDHADILKGMSTSEKDKMMKRVEEIYNQKAGVAAHR